MKCTERRKKPSPSGKVAGPKALTDEGKQPKSERQAGLNGGVSHSTQPVRYGFPHPSRLRRSTFPVGEGFLRRGPGLHIRFDGTDEDIPRYHSVLGGEALGEVVGIQHLGVGGELIVPFPDQDLHPVGADEVKLVARVSVL